MCRPFGSFIMKHCAKDFFVCVDRQFYLKQKDL